MSGMRFRQKGELRQSSRELGRNSRLLESVTIIPYNPKDSKDALVLKSRIRGEPLNAGLYNDLGVQLTKEKKLKEAEKVLRAGLKVDPQDSDLWDNLGVALAEQNETAKAEKAFERAIKLSSDIPVYYAHLANIYIQQDLFASAILVCDRFLGGEQDDPGIRMILGTAFLGKGLRGLAIDQFEIAAQLTADPSGVEELAELNKQAKKLIEEIKALRYTHAPDTKAGIKQIVKRAMEQ